MIHEGITELKWVKFLHTGPRAGQTTHHWTCVGTGGDNDIIGSVDWRPGWRRYVFNSHTAAYDAGCLLEIAQFVGEVNAHHQSQRKVVSHVGIQQEEAADRG